MSRQTEASGNETPYGTPCGGDKDDWSLASTRLAQVANDLQQTQRSITRLNVPSSSLAEIPESMSMIQSNIKADVIKGFLKILNTANKEELMTLKGIKERRATHILELRKESSEPFKSLNDLAKIGLTPKQIKDFICKGVEELFD